MLQLFCLLLKISRTETNKTILQSTINQTQNSQGKNAVKVQKAEQWKMDNTTQGIEYLFFKDASLLRYKKRLCNPIQDSCFDWIPHVCEL